MACKMVSKLDKLPHRREFSLSHDSKADASMAFEVNNWPAITIRANRQDLAVFELAVSCRFAGSLESILARRT